MRFVPRGTLAALFLLALFCLPARAQQVVTIYSGKLTTLGYCQLSSLATSTALTACSGGIPSGTQYVNAIIEGAEVRYRTDGTAPTASTGMPLLVGTDKVFTLSTIKNLQFIQVTPSASVNIEFYK